jgi:tetratricopeptide (TPR) repeat protein
MVLIPLFFGMNAAVFADSPDYSFYKKHGHSKKQWDSFVKSGFEAYDQQDCTQALSFLKQAIGAQCQDPLVYYKVAVCSEAEGSLYTAIQYYQLSEEQLQKLPAPHSYQKDIYENYGRALFQAKKFQEAFPYLTRAAAIGTPSFGLFYMVAKLYQSRNDPRAALEYFDRALTQDTRGAPPLVLASVYKEVAKAKLQAKENQKAAQLIDKSLKLQPQDPEAMQIRSQIITQLQQENLVKIIENLGNASSPETMPSKPTSPTLETQPMNGSLHSTPTTLRSSPPANPTTQPTSLNPLPPVAP